MNRRERTRQLIELGGLVAKAGLVELTNDDRAVLYGAFLAVTTRLSQHDGELVRNAWRERGRAAFEEDEAKRAR